MTKCILVAFHPGCFNPSGHYRVYEDAWMKCWSRWAHLFDKVYLIDHNWDFDPSKLSDKFQLFTVKKSHWDNLKEIIPQIKEDWILMMDCDTLFYDGQEMSRLLNSPDFAMIDLAAILDGSGGVDLSKKYPEMAPNKYRGERRRIAPYLCFIKTELMKKTSMDFSPYHSGQNDWRDSFGKWTEEVLDFSPTFLELPDDRTTLRLEKNGTISKDSWLDGPGYKWSEPLDAPQRYGYYHIRNFSLGLYLVNTFFHDRVNYEKAKRITPFSEALRVLTWLYVVADAAKTPLAIFPITDVIDDFGVSIKTWNNYWSKFKDYHSWVKDL